MKKLLAIFAVLVISTSISFATVHDHSAAATDNGSFSAVVWTALSVTHTGGGALGTFVTGFSYTTFDVGAIVFTFHGQGTESVDYSIVANASNTTNPALTVTGLTAAGTSAVGSSVSITPTTLDATTAAPGAASYEYDITANYTGKGI